MVNLISRATVLSGLLILVAPWSIAQEEDEELFSLFDDEEYLFELAGGSNQTTKTAPSVATIITAETIRASGAKTLAEAMELVPGVHAHRTVTQNFSFSLRGQGSSDNPQILIMLDGLALKQLGTGGTPNNFTMPVNNIERLEVIRGPGSALHGADAFSGVINIVTKSDVGDGKSHTYAGSRAGNDGYVEGWVQHTSNISGWNVALSLETWVTDGYNEAYVERDSQAALDAIFGTSASLAPGSGYFGNELLYTTAKASNENWSLSGGLWKLNNAESGLGVLYVLDEQGSSDTTYAYGSLGYQTKINDNWSTGFDVDASWMEEDLRYNVTPPGSLIPIGTDGGLLTGSNLVFFPDGVISAPGGEQTNLTFSAHAKATLGNHKARFSLGYRQEDVSFSASKNTGLGVIDGSQPVVDGTLTDITGTQFIFAPDQTRKVIFASFEDEWMLSNDWILTAGARYDDFNDFGDTLNPRVALVWLAGLNVTNKFLYGRAFRAPSALELSGVNNPVRLGSPDVKPEKVDNVEWSLRWDVSPKLALETTAYYYYVEDVIVYQAEAGAGNVATNAGQQTGAGFELEAEWKIAEDWSLESNFAFVDVELDIDGAVGHVADVPSYLGYIGLRGHRL